MIKIAPSILSADFAYLARDIEKIATADYVHVDVMCPISPSASLW